MYIDTKKDPIFITQLFFVKKIINDAIKIRFNKIKYLRIKAVH